MPFTAISDQEVERGRYIYEALLEEEVTDEKEFFENLTKARDMMLVNCAELDAQGDTEKWLFYATVFLGIGMMLRERIEIYEELIGD